MSAVGLAHRDVEVLALAQRQAGLVEQAHQAQHLGVREAEVGQPVERDPRQAEQRVAGVDRLGDAVDRPQRRPVAALDVAVLDVVVDEREVVAELDRRRARAGRAGGRRRCWRRRAGRAAAGSACHPTPRTRRARGGSGPSRTARGWTRPGRRRAARSRLRCRRGGRRGRSPARQSPCAGECTRNVFVAGSLLIRTSGRSRTTGPITAPADRVLPSHRCPSRAATRPRRSSSRASTWARRTG